MEKHIAGDTSVYGSRRTPDLRGARGVAAFAVAAALFLVAVVVALAPVKATVDGVERTLPAGTTVGDLVRAGLTKAPRGDLRSVTGGVAKKLGGRPPAVAVDGEEARPTDLVPAGASVTSSRGRDVVESVVTTMAATPVPVVETGKGPDVTIESIGAPGLAVVKMGLVSHSVVESLTILAASPMRVRRAPFPPGAKIAALTFDDGPWPGQTERVLEILARDGVHATFFMMGLRVRHGADLARRVVAEGHSVGSHTMSHAILTRVAPAAVHDQMAGGEALIRDVTGVEPLWFRAPGGSVNAVVRAEANALGMRIVGWTTDPNDWRKPPAAQIVARVMGGLRPGAIVLLHDGGGDRSQTIAALPEILRLGREQGYRFVTLDELYATQ